MQQFTFIIFTEDKAGLLNRITIIFARRKINIDSITCTESEVKGIFRFTILVQTTAETALKVTKQINKQVEVIKACHYEAEEVIYQEIALFKVSLRVWQESVSLENLLRENHARILTVTQNFLVIEKTGHASEIQFLLDTLSPFGILEFVRSGRVALTKTNFNLTAYLEEG